MPIVASQLMTNRPSAEEEYKQVAELAGSVAKLSMQKMAEILASFSKARSEPRYFSPPFTPPSVRRQRITIVISMTIDLPFQE